MYWEEPAQKSYSEKKKLEVAVLLRTCLNPPAPAGVLWRLGPGKCLAGRGRPKKGPLLLEPPISKGTSL